MAQRALGLLEVRLMENQTTMLERLNYLQSILEDAQHYISGDTPEVGTPEVVRDDLLVRIRTALVTDVPALRKPVGENQTTNRRNAMADPIVYAVNDFASIAARLRELATPSPGGALMLVEQQAMREAWQQHQHHVQQQLSAALAQHAQQVADWAGQQQQHPLQAYAQDPGHQHQQWAQQQQLPQAQQQVAADQTRYFNNG
jgi:hypothetical protein